MRIVFWYGIVHAINERQNRSSYIAFLSFCSSVKAAHNITHEFGTPLPIKEHQNDSSLEKQNTGNEHVQTPSKEAYQGPDNIQHDTLRFNIFPKASISHQDSKTNQVSILRLM